MLAIPGGFFADAYLGAKRAALWGGTRDCPRSFLDGRADDGHFLSGARADCARDGAVQARHQRARGRALRRRTMFARDSGFSIFYMGINVGGLLAPRRS